MILSCPLTWTRSVLWQHIVNVCVVHCIWRHWTRLPDDGSSVSETCWSTFKYFIILIVSTYYIFYISWKIKCLIVVFSVVTLRSKVSEGYTAYIFRMPTVFSETSGKINCTARFKEIKDPHLNISRQRNLSICIKFTSLEDWRWFLSVLSS